MFTHVSHDFILAMNTISMTIIDYMTISRLYIFGGELMVALISHILPFHCNLSNGCMSDCWKLTPGPSSQHRTSFKRQVHTHTHTKRPMWFHKRFPMLISSTEIQLISVTHPYPDSMCSFKPRNWGDEKHARSYPVQSNQYHFLVHASTALCCHMILPPKIVIDSNWFHHLFWDLLASHSPTATLPASCRFWFSLLWQPFKAPSSIS